ncbi:MAG: thioredoxin family protein [Salinimicrobium sp.]
MKKITLFLLLLSLNMSAGNWIHDLDEARKLSLGTNKLMLVDFWASWCGPCRKMDQESWSDPEVQKLMSNYIPVQVDIDNDRISATRYAVKAIPFVFIMDGNGEVVFKSMSYMPREEVLELLKKYAVNTQFLQAEAINYYKHQNYVNSLRLAEQYIDFSLYLSPEVREDFLGVAATYLRGGEKMLKRKQKNYDLMKEKVSFLETMVELYRGNYDKVEKFLEKTDAEEISPYHEEMYGYLNLAVATRETSAEEVERWKNYLSSRRNSEAYLKRYSLFVQSSGKP